MTDLLSPSPAAAGTADAHALVLPSLSAMLHDLPPLLQSDSPSAAHQAAQLLHQAARALDMVQQPGLARLLRSMEGTLRQPGALHAPAQDDATGPATRDVLLLAARDAMAHLQTLQAGRPAAVAHLFPAYRAVCKLGGKDTAHPADLWELQWQLAPVPAPLPAALQVAPHAVAPATRALLDQQVLAVVKTADAGAAAQLRDLCLGLAQTRTQASDTAFWHAAAGCFDATAHGLLEQDLYTKRLASRVLMHYAGVAKAADTPVAPPDILVRDLLYYCAQAADTGSMLMDGLPPVLHAVCRNCQLLPADTLAHTAIDTDQPVDSWTLDLGQGAEAFAAPVVQPVSLATPTPEHTSAPPQELPDPGLNLSHLVFGDEPEPPAEPTPAPAPAPASTPAPAAAAAPTTEIATATEKEAAHAPAQSAAGQLNSITAPTDTAAPSLAPADWAEQTPLAPEPLHSPSAEAHPEAAPDAPADSAMPPETEAETGTETAPAPQAVAEPIAQDAVVQQAVEQAAAALDGAETVADHSIAPSDAGSAEATAAPMGSETTEAPATSAEVFEAAALPSEAVADMAVAADAQAPAVAEAAKAGDADDATQAFDAVQQETTPEQINDAAEAEARAAPAPAAELQPIAPEAPSPAAPESEAACAHQDCANPEFSAETDVPEAGTASGAESAFDGHGHGHEHDHGLDHSETAADTAPPVPVVPAAPSTPLAAPRPVVELQPGAALLQGNAAQPQLEPNQGFLTEADALSQQLQSCIQAWAAAPEAALPAEAAEHARALTRSAWGAGCTEISLLTHTLQMVLDRLRTQATPAQREACVHAADEVLRLLHQFAAGFMRRSQPQILEELNRILADTASAPAASDATAPAPEAQDATAQADDAHTTFIDGTAADAPAQQPPPPSAPAPVAQASVDQLEPVRFAVFEEEVNTIWPALQAALHQWMAQPAEQGTPRQTLLRSLHTLKGSARLAGAAAWASQVHALEDLALLAQPNDGPLGPSALQQPLEVLRLGFVALQQELAARHPERSLQHWGASPIDTVGRHAQALWSTHDQTEQALADNRLTLAEMDSCLQRLRSQLKDCAAWADTLVLHGDMDLSYEWHEELHDLVRALGDCTDDIGTVQQQVQHGLATAETALSTQAGHLRALQHTLLYARLTPLAQLHERLLGTVQLAASDTGKATELLLEGGEQLMERSVADQLAPALEHLLRNCVDHGIESAAQRQAAGKPATGRITLQLHTAGTQQTLTVQDDGAGLSLERIRNKAQALGLLAEGETVDAARAAELILHPGLSTAAQITELSGRGIGMDAVLASVQQLGGQLRITSQAGQGCTFTITLPAPPQVEQVVALRAGSWSMALPARSVEAVRRIPAAQMEQALSQGMLPDDVTGPMPLYWAGAVWQQSARSSAPALDGQAVALVVRSSTSRWALQVDEVLGTQEVALQAATDVAVPLPGLLGTAAQPSGQVLQVYDPYEALAAHEARRLLQSTQAAAPAADTADAAAPEAVRPLILLADDSMSVRRLAQHLLQTQGYQVVTAADGLQAWNLLESGELPARPALLLADIEMPEMDGLELLRRVRAHPASKQLPVVMLTAHEAGPVSQKAIDAGAQAFLTKPYAPNELLALVRRCARVPEADGLGLGNGSGSAPAVRETAVS